MISEGHSPLPRIRPFRFLDALDAENEIEWPYVTFENRFFDQ
jgi:hypothetical protein